MKNKTIYATSKEVDNIVKSYGKEGYTPTIITDKMVKLVKPKKFQKVWFILLFILFVVPSLFVVLSYLVDSDKSLIIIIKE